MKHVLLEEPGVITPARVVAGETVQLECRVRYYDGEEGEGNSPKVIWLRFLLVYT